MKSIFCVFILALATTLSVHAEDEDGGMNGDRAQARGLSEVNPVDDHAFGGELDVYLQALQSAGSQAEAHYQDSLKRLKARAADFAPMVEQMYWTAKSDDYFKRWALVHAMGELEVAPAACEACARSRFRPFRASGLPVFSRGSQSAKRRR